VQTDQTSTHPNAYIHWESQHVGFTYDEDRQFDFSLGGRFGFQSALTLVQTAPPSTPQSTTAATSSPKVPSSQYQEAFAWDIKGQSHLHINESTLEAFVTSGQVILNSNSQLVDTGGGQQEIVVLAGQDASRAAWFFEGGIGFKKFDRAVELQHEDPSTPPKIDISLAYRHDLRFEQDNNALVSFRSPTERVVFRFMLTGIRVTDRRDPKKPATFSVSFGVEHEFALHAGGVPSGTKLLIRGDLNVLQALRGTQ